MDSRRLLLVAAVVDLRSDTVLLRSGERLEGADGNPAGADR